MRPIIFALFSFALISCTSDQSSDLISDGDGKDLSQEIIPKAFNHNQICQPVPKVWILPVAHAKRSQAIEYLGNKKFLAVNKRTFSDLHSPLLSENITIAQTLFNDAFDWLNKNPDDSSYRYCHSSSGKQCADELAMSLGTRPRASSAYLVSAIAKHEQTGFHSVEECEDGVYIHHISLGPDIEPVKTPLIVILSRPPLNVITSAGTALQIRQLFHRKIEHGFLAAA